MIHQKPVNCTRCGAPITFSEYSTRMTCPYCGATYISVISGEPSQPHIPSGDQPIDIRITPVDVSSIRIASQTVSSYGIPQANDLQTFAEILAGLSYYLKKRYEFLIQTTPVGQAIERTALSTDQQNWKDERVISPDAEKITKKELQQIKKRYFSNYEVHEIWDEQSRNVSALVQTAMDKIRR